MKAELARLFQMDRDRLMEGNEMLARELDELRRAKVLQPPPLPSSWEPEPRAPKAPQRLPSVRNETTVEWMSPESFRCTQKRYSCSNWSTAFIPADDASVALGLHGL